MGFIWNVTFGDGLPNLSYTARVPGSQAFARERTAALNVFSVRQSLNQH